jgi:hypothetical protein
MPVVIVIIITARLFLYATRVIADTDWFELRSPGWWVFTAVLHLPYFGIMFFLIKGRAISWHSLHGAWGLPAADTLQVLRAHEASHPLASHSYACFRQFGVNARHTASTFGVLVDFTDPVAQLLICLCPR